MGRLSVMLAGGAVISILASGCAFRAEVGRGPKTPETPAGTTGNWEVQVGGGQPQGEPAARVTSGERTPETSVVFLPGEPEIARSTLEAALRGDPLPIAGNLARGEVREPQTEVERRVFRMINFDYDSYEIREEARQILAEIAAYMLRDREVRIAIEGHCDERGTEEYNMTLGEKRALAARQYLVTLGVSPDRIGTLSYGKERPLAPGVDEGAWSVNRRCEFRILERQAQG